MSGFDVREYQSVILGALLHDVGKLLHRGNDEYKYSNGHEAASAQFITKFYDRLKNDALYDINLVRVLVRHHKPKTPKSVILNDDDIKDKSEDDKNRIWKLIQTIRQADIYSCVERERDKDKQSGFADRHLPLVSIFSGVNLDGATRREQNKTTYSLTPLKANQSFPMEIESLKDNEIKNTIKLFEESIPYFSAFKSFDDVLNKWLNILEEHMWAVPSDTRYETSDVSLYDHLRSTAAIAACLYKRHIVAIEEGKKLDRINEFIFIGGDFSGIQDYIFDITNRGSGGAAKRLRARSFFISVFSEATIHKILHSLDLPIVCNLFSSGGKFLLLAPNVEGLESTLQNVKKEIEREIHKTYFNQFSFIMAWMPKIKGFKEKFKVYSFFSIADEMFHLLETEKARKSLNVLLDVEAGKWNEHAFVADELYEEYQKHGACSICGRGPATHEEKEKDEEDEAVRCCFTCYRDKLIGQRLPKAEFVAFGRGDVSKEDEDEGKRIVIFHKQENDGRQKDYYAEFLDSWKESDDFYLIYDIGQQGDSANKNRLIPLKKYYANYIPTSEKGVLDFEDIAGCSNWQNGEKKFGSSLIGVLKADVDNLGLIFSKGFENPDRLERGLTEIDRKTVSRYLTMSRMLDLFFSGWVKETMSNGSKESLLTELNEMDSVNQDRLKKYLESDAINFRNIYTVYSGGDDLVLVGPWETMVVFSIFLNMQFRKYTCNNQDITMSAGLAVVKPKHPIASAIKQADELLDKSKKEGKDRITLFGTTVKWEKMSELTDFFLFLDEKLSDDNSNVNPAFLYRLLQYHRMALGYLVEHKIEGLKYLSALSYDMGRNIVERDKKGVITKGHQEQKVFQTLINQRPDKNSIVYNMKIPLFWALYRNRKSYK